MNSGTRSIPVVVTPPSCSTAVKSQARRLDRALGRACHTKRGGRNLRRRGDGADRPESFCVCPVDGGIRSPPDVSDGPDGSGELLPASDARILYMATLPLAEVRANLSRLVDEAVRTHERIEVTRQGRRAAVILSADDYDSIIETLAILSDQELMREVREAEAEADRGEVYTLAEVTKEMRACGRLPQ
jgi:antitoxin YefM